MIKLAVNLSMIFTEVPLIERFALAQAQGFKHVEIQFPYELTIEQIQSQLTMHDLTLCLINLPAGDLMQGGNGLAGVPGMELEFHRGLEQAIQYATALNVPSVNILAGKQPLDSDLLPCLNTLSSNLKLACHRLSDHHIQPVFEMINSTDMPRFLVQNIAQAQEMLEAVQHPALKMQYDCYHMAMMGEDVLEALKENIHDIGHIQFADIPHRHQPNTGTLNYRQIFKTIDDLGYQGFCGAEYHPLGHTLDSLTWLKQYGDGDE